MNYFKKSFVFTALYLVLSSAYAKGEMKPVEGYTPQIGLMIYMLEDLKTRITDQVKGLNQSETDFLYDEDANSIGSLIMHLVSTEAYYQVQTLEGRPWTEEEQNKLVRSQPNPTNTNRTTQPASDETPGKRPQTQPA